MEKAQKQHTVDSTWTSGRNAWAGELQELYCASNYF